MRWLLWERFCCGFLQDWPVNCNLPLTYDYSACLLTANICSHISLYIVNYQECFKKIITTIIFSRNHQLRRRLPLYFMLMRRRFVRCNFIGHHGWNGRESANQLWQHISHIKTLYFLSHQPLMHNLLRLLPCFGYFKHFSRLEGHFCVSPGYAKNHVHM